MFYKIRGNNMQEEVNKAIKSDLLDEKHLQKLIQLAKEELNKN